MGIRTRRVAAAVLLALLGSAAASQPQVTAPVRYFWDTRPAHCPHLYAGPSPECRMDSWPSAEVTAERLQQLAGRRQFVLLEHALEELTSEPGTFPDGSTRAAAVLRLLSETLEQHKAWPREHPTPSVLAAWRAQRPHSPFVDIAEAWQMPPAQGQQKMRSLSPLLQQTAVWRMAIERIAPGAPVEPVAAAGVNPYPWDDRPPKCRTPGAPPVGMCALNAWQWPLRSQARLSELWASRNWRVLELALTELTRSNAYFAEGTSHAALVERWLLDVVQDGDPGPAIAAWKAAHPDSPFVPLAEAQHLLVKAWSARGSGYAGTVSREAWKLFSEQLLEAERKLLAAPASVRETAAWHLVLLKVALDARGRTDPQQLFVDATRRWPRETRFYSHMVSRMVPKWGGSWPQVESFVAAATRNAEATEGQSTYARLYLDLVMHNAEEIPMDWPRMRSGFEDWIRRYPANPPLDAYASFACRARDKAAFTRVMQMLRPSDIAEVAWLPGYSPEACLRWASQ